LQINLPVAIGEEDVLTVDATLGEVVGDARKDGSGHARHR
jgi:hypothetical protein